MRKLLLLFFMVFIGTIHGQTIALQNASFDGEPQDATTPIGWLECEVGTTPDILPGPWGVYLEAQEGDTYVGLITRKNGTWEAIGQRLSNSLKKGQCYALTLQLAFTETYAGYNEPVQFRLWGGDERCEKKQLLGSTEPVSHEDWKEYGFEFTPDYRIKYLIFEAYYDTNKKYTHDGNILLDNISVIKACPRA